MSSKFYILFAIVVFVLSISLFSQTSPKSMVGKKFWVSWAKIDSNLGGLEPNIGEVNCHVSIHTTGVVTSGRIITPDTVINFVINASNQFSFESFVLDSLFRKYYVANSEVIENKGVYIETNDDVVVYQYGFRKNLISTFPPSVQQQFTSSTIVYPLNALTNTYYVVTRAEENRPTQFLIVATVDSTIVEITPSKQTEAGRLPNVPFTITLNKGQTYLVRSATEDLTSSKIVSKNAICKPIAVFCGTTCTRIKNIQITEELFNPLFQQMPPVELLGKQYISYLSKPIHGRGAFYKIITVEDSTDIVANGIKIGNFLKASECIELFSDTLTYIYSNNPILVAQFTNGIVWQFPTMTILPSIDQVSNKIILPKYTANLFPRTTETNRSYLYIVTNYNSRLSTRINGQPTNPDNWYFSPFLPTVGIYLQLDPSYLNTITIENPIAGVQAYSYYWQYTRQGLALRGATSFGNSILGAFDSIGIYENNTYCQNGVSSFGAIADNSATQFLWEFGDGGKGEGKNVEHIYEQPGQYALKLIIYRDAFCSYDTVRKTITVRASPAVKAGTRPTILLCNGQTATLGTNQLPGVTYRWSPAIGLSDTAVGQPTVTALLDSVKYYVRGYDQFGCETRDSIVVKLYDQPIANAGPDTVSCGGNGVQIGRQTTGGTPNYSFLWTPADGLSNDKIERPIAAPSTNTTYILRVTDANGCIAYDTVNIQALPSPTIDAGNPVTICEGDSVQLNATGANQFRWVNAQNISDTTIGNPTVYPSVTTTYYVAGLFPTGCVAFDSVLVTVTPKPRLPIAFQTTACPNATKTYTVENRGDLTYNWTTISGSIISGQGTNEVTVTWGSGPTGSIKLTTTTSTGSCKFDTVVVITISSDVKPTITENKKNTIVPSLGTVRICPNESVTLDVGVGYTEITWTNGSTSRQTTVSTEGWYGVSVKDATGCSGGDSVFVEVVPPPTVFAGNDRVLCGADTAVMRPTVTGSGTYTYQWIPPTAVSDPSALVTNFIAPTTTNLIFQAIDTVNGCVTSDTVLMTILSISNDIISTSKGSNILCFGEQMTLDAGAFDSYLWSTGETTRTITITSGGSYWVDAKSGSCSAIDTIQIVQNPQIVVIPTPDITASPGATVTLDANATGGTLPYQFQWTPNVNFVDPTTVQSPRVTASVGSQTYIVTITDANDCVASDTITVFVPSTATTVTVARREVSATAFGERFPITLTLDPNTPITPSGFTATITVPFEQFIPKSVTNGTMTITQNATDYVINLSVQIDEPLYNNSVITELVGDILLGQQDSTTIVLTSAQWTGTTYPVNAVNGAIVLNDVCYSGTRRYLLPTTVGFGILSVQPNPANNKATFEFGIIEAGQTTFEIIDVFGNVVHSTSWNRLPATPKGGTDDSRTTHTVDVSNLPSGTYYGVLKSFSQRESVPLVITR